jgi:hypothetical protein
MPDEFLLVLGLRSLRIRETRAQEAQWTPLFLQRESRHAWNELGESDYLGLFDCVYARLREGGK